MRLVAPKPIKPRATATATATDPLPANSPTLHSRLVCKDKNKCILGKVAYLPKNSTFFFSKQQFSLVFFYKQKYIHVQVNNLIYMVIFDICYISVKCKVVHLSKVDFCKVRICKVFISKFQFRITP